MINDKPKESIPNLINEAKTNHILKDVSKRQLEARIKDIAVKEKRGSDTVCILFTKRMREIYLPIYTFRGLLGMSKKRLKNKSKAFCHSIPAN